MTTSSRRTLLGLGLAGGAGVVAGCSTDEPAPAAAPTTTSATLPANAVMDLRERGVVASATPYRQSYLRFGPGLVTGPEDVDATVAAVAEIV